MAIYIEDTAIGPRLAGPEADGTRSARVQLEGRKGEERLTIGTRGYGGCGIDTALKAAREIIECVEAIRAFEQNVNFTNS